MKCAGKKPPGMPKVGIVCLNVPELSTVFCRMIRDPEVASRDNKCLEESCRVTLTALQCHGGRAAMVVTDETVWHANWELICSLRPDDNLCYIGGYVERAREEDCSYLPKNSKDLPPERLSKVSQHYGQFPPLLRRYDSRGPKRSQDPLLQVMLQQERLRR